MSMQRFIVFSFLRLSRVFAPFAMYKAPEFIKAKSMTAVLKNKNVYHVKNAIKLGQYNVGRDGDILTIPLYTGFLIQDKLTDAIIPMLI